MNMDMETNQISVSIGAKEDEKLTFEELRDDSNEVMERIADIEGIDTIGAMAGGSSTMSMMSGGDESVSMYVLLDEDSNVNIGCGGSDYGADKRYGLSGLLQHFFHGL